MKMMKSILTWGIAMVAGATMATAQHLTIQSHIGSTEHGSRVMSRTYDDTGMSGDSGSALATNDTHSTDVANHIGLLNGDTPPLFIEYDLGESFSLTNLVIWNDNEPSWFKQGMKNCTIEIREQSGPSVQVFAGDIPLAPAMGTGVTTASIDIDLTGNVARYIRFTTAALPDHSWRFFVDTTSNDVACSLSEVRVYGDPTGLGNTNTAQACCFIDGTCQQVESVDCTNAGGTPQGPGSECVTTICPQLAEACCFNDGLCQDLDPIVCAGQGGIAQGSSSTCGTTACPQPESCCFNDGSCQDLLPTDCSNAGGIPGGFFSTCATPDECPQLEACCLPDGTCQDLLPDLCAGISGTSQGADTACSFADCVGATLGTATNVVSVDLADNSGISYNVERATSLNPDWADADPSFHLGDGGEATLTADRDDPNAFYRYGSDAALAAVGNPTAGNGWDTTSEVSARANTERLVPNSFRPLISIIDGSGMAANGSEHINNPPTDQMWLAQGGNIGPERFATTNDGVWAEFNLGSAKDISDMLIWNYGESAPGGWTIQGMKDCQIFYTTVNGGAAIPTSTDPNAGWGSDDINDWTQVGGAGNMISLNRADTLSSPGFFTATDTIEINDMAQYVLILGADSSSNANHTGGTNPDVALSEVRFVLTDQPPTPEILATTLGDQTCFSFTSVSGTVYELERAEQLVVGVPIGNPNAGNGWDTTGAVSIDHHSSHPSAADRGVGFSIDGSGISGDIGELHGTSVGDTMWLSRPLSGGVDGSPQNAGQTPGSHYVTYAFDQAYTLDSTWIWNWNEQAFPGHGWKDLEIQVSTNNGTNTNDWVTVHTGNLPISPTTGNLSPSAVIDLGGVVAQYVAVINTGFGTDENHGGGGGFANNSGLSEVRFYEPGVGPPDISTAQFEGTGAKTTGDGGTQVLYDPNGHDTNFWYRVVPQ